MIINMSRLFTAEGLAMEQEAEIGFDSLYWQGSMLRVSDAQPLRLRLLHTGGRKVRITGSVSVSLTIPCDFCLSPVEVPFSLEIDCEADADETAAERLEDLNEQPYIDGYDLDTDALVRNELYLAMPGQVLCRDDCRGLCPSCGKNLNEGSCGCRKPSQDFRMSVFLDILNPGDGSSR